MEANNYTYEFTENGRSSLEEILEYISVTLDNPKAADDLLDKVDAALDSACVFPNAIPSFSEDVRDIKKLIVENYKVYFIILEKEKILSVLKVLYGGMNATEEKIRK